MHDDLKQLIDAANKILVVQADNPDGDSLGSALALEEILGDMGKSVYLYCGVDIPGYLHYLKGWDRVLREVPSSFDLSIIVDTSALALMEKLQQSGNQHFVASKPCIVLDHHDVENTVHFANVVCNLKAVATGEIIYELAQEFNWPLNQRAVEFLTASIMSDSLGLTSEATTARSIHIVGELVEKGASLARLESNRRELMRKSPELVKYKGELLQRIEYYADGRVASVTIPWAEIEKYSPAYNPSMLVMDEMRNTTGAQLAVAFKIYNDGHITGKIRANLGYDVAAKLANHFGGGGHPYASGFKITDGRPFNEIKSECINYATELLNNLERKTKDEAIQHTDA